MARELARTYTTMDWVLRLDADEVLHEKDIENLKRFTNDDRFNTIEISFYHFMVYPWLYQYIEPKGILMRTGSFSWIKDVHEVPRTTEEFVKNMRLNIFIMDIAVVKRKFLNAGNSMLKLMEDQHGIKELILLRY